MDIVEQLEYPLPILKVLAEKIVVETSRNESGALLVDNIGGGVLSGRVMSNSPALRFHTSEFSGNQLSLDYSISIDGCKAGDILQSEVVVMSNGGEKTVPVIIKVIPAFIVTAEDIRLGSLKDFLAYAKKYPVQARRLFSGTDFMMWLTSIGYEYMDIFDKLVQDANKERALENFFILSRLKNRALLSVDRDRIDLRVGPEQKDPVTGEITVNKTGWGYVEAEVLSEADWLEVKPDCIKEFTPEDTAVIKYTVNPAKLTGKLNRAVIRLSDGISVSIEVRRKSHINVSTDRRCYSADDMGILRVSNNCGQDIMLEITTREGFCRFEGRKYFMGANAEIPFTVRLNALQSAQLGIKRRPFMENEIYITAHVGTKTVRRTVRIIAGNRK